MAAGYNKELILIVVVPSVSNQARNLNKAWGNISIYIF